MIVYCDYALYKGEDLLAMGSIKEIAKIMGVKESTIRFYGTPSYRKRLSERKRSFDARELVCLI